MKKTLIVLVVLAVGLTVLVAWLASRLDVAEIEANLIDKTEAATGLSIDAGQVELRPLRGVVLSDLRVSGTLAAGEVNAQIGALELRHRFWPLLRGRVVIDRLTLEQPIVSLTTRAVVDEGRSEPTRQSSATKRERRRRRRSVAESALADEMATGLVQGHAGVEWAIEHLVVEGGRLAATKRGGETVDLAAEELDIRIRQLTFDTGADSFTQAISGQGTMSFARLSYGEVEAESVQGEVELGNGQARLTQLRLLSRSGRVEKAEVEVDLETDPFRYSVAARGSLDLNRMTGYRGEGGFGAVSFTFRGGGSGPELAALGGFGETTLAAGGIPPLPSIVEVEKLLDRRILSGRAYERSIIRYRLAEKVLEIEPFKLVGEGGAIDGEGTIGLDGVLGLDLTVSLELDNSGLEGLAAAILTQVLGGDGPPTIPLEVGGTLAQPRFRLASHSG